ncbi:UvrD-helicase domain-containing protein [Marininema halotolerans]|uniref:DNA 3'-5' helicase n=1 Tax=Marininema halotolerans TaxID=1155944 RepID=A0A1I6SEC1_9BACL|nr:UvrD-helicase domain-containing protein [Marininema halotolerans]SFS75190.1 UvrD-like helicase C-terminal domain-containing protein [Marininema halotolerans]
MLKVAMHESFLKSFNKLPSSERKRTEDMIRKLRNNPQNTGLNVEKYKEAMDSRVCSIRTSHSYRAIGLLPDQGKTLLLLWVDHHDEAYRWARKKRFSMNPQSDAISIWSTTEEQIGQPDISQDEKLYTLFSRYTDRELLDIGVSDDLLDKVKSLQSIEDLLRTKELLSEASFAGLQFLTEGDSYDDVYQFVQEYRVDELAFIQRKEQQVENFEQSIRKADKEIVLVTSDEHLQAILDQPLEKWRIFLHPDQQDIVDNHYAGPVRVLGGAGTGKTVVALHRACKLVRNLLMQDEKILITAFNLSLTDTLRKTMQGLCTVEEMKQVDIISIDRLARQIVDKHLPGVVKNVAIDRKKFEYIWLEALSSVGWDRRSLSFVQDEYDQMIQYHGIEIWEEYQHKARKGRGSRISSSDRKKVWQIVENYRREMRKIGWMEYIDVLRLARKWLEAHPNVEIYRSVIVDEVQDFHPEALKLLRALVPNQDNDMLLAGDSHQRIYARHTTFRECGIDIRGQRSKRLSLNYRTTEEIRSHAVQILGDHHYDDLDGGEDKGRKQERSILRGIAPNRVHFSCAEGEFCYVVEQISQLLEQRVSLEEVAILARTNGLAEQISHKLTEAGIFAWMMTNQVTEGKGIMCTTMHRSKGLEFRVVFLIAVNENILPPISVQRMASDEKSREEIDRLERSLLYVAATRARDCVHVTSYGTSSMLWPVKN